MTFSFSKVAPLSLFVLFSFSLTFSQTTETTEFTSLYTGDTYRLIVKKPQGFDPTKKYDVVYVTDASLNSGKLILNLDAGQTKNCILVGIGHIGSHVLLRQRDFIPSDAGGYKDKDFGQASRFYLFIKNELMPFVNGKIVIQKNKIFIGHSFGGLLALYFSLRENKLFDRYYAISPSVWANHNELVKIEETYKMDNSSYSSTIYLYAGSLEVFNKVLESTTKFYEKVKSRNYKDLTISCKKIDWANHYNIVQKVVPEIFRQIN